MEVYTPSLRIRANQVAPEPLKSDLLTPKQSFYKPPSRVSSYSSQKSNANTPSLDISSSTEFPILGNSQVSTSKIIKKQGWSQLAKDWAEKDKQEEAKRIADEEKANKICNSGEVSVGIFNRVLVPTFVKTKKQNYFQEESEQVQEQGQDLEQFNASSNPLGIKKDNWEV